MSSRFQIQLTVARLISGCLQTDLDVDLFLPKYFSSTVKCLLTHKLTPVEALLAWILIAKVSLLTQRPGKHPAMVQMVSVRFLKESSIGRCKQNLKLISVLLTCLNISHFDVDVTMKTTCARSPVGAYLQATSMFPVSSGKECKGLC